MTDFKKFMVKMDSMAAKTSVPWMSKGNWGGLAPMIISGQIDPEKERERQERDDTIRLFSSKLQEYVSDPKRRVDPMLYNPFAVQDKLKQLVEGDMVGDGLDEATPYEQIAAVVSQPEYSKEPFMQPYGTISRKYDRDTFCDFLREYVFPHMGAICKLKTTEEHAMYDAALLCVRPISTKAMQVYSQTGNAGYDGLSFQIFVFTRDDGVAVIGAVSLYRVVTFKNGKAEFDTNMSVVWWDACPFIKEELNQATVHIH